MGALLLAAGRPGMRHALPNSRIMIHQPHGQAAGQASDIIIQAEEILKLKRQIYQIFVKHTHQPFDKIGNFWSHLQQIPSYRPPPNST